jgi:hypothetical protein
MVTDQAATDAEGLNMGPERQSWMQRRAEALAMLPAAPKRPLERPSHAQEAALPDAHRESHRWIVATEIPVMSIVAREADFRGTFRVEAGVKIEVLEVYCSACRRPYGDVAGIACEAAQSVKFGGKDHLLGGRPHERARRKTSARVERALTRERTKKAEKRAAHRERQAHSDGKGTAA